MVTRELCKPIRSLFHLCHYVIHVAKFGVKASRLEFEFELFSLFEQMK